MATNFSVPNIFFVIEVWEVKSLGVFRSRLISPDLVAEEILHG
tara:strand:+ start:224 stop:352 length:129 start_codon:yes stop_codon:yes gene_type:complete